MFQIVYVAKLSIVVSPIMKLQFRVHTTVYHIIPYTCCFALTDSQLRIRSVGDSWPQTCRAKPMVAQSQSTPEWFRNPAVPLQREHVSFYVLKFDPRILCRSKQIKCEE